MFLAQVMNEDRSCQKVVNNAAPVCMPDTEENQAAYPQPSGQKPGLGFSICRIVGITCLGSGVLLNTAIGLYQGKGSDEQALTAMESEAKAVSPR